MNIKLILTRLYQEDEWVLYGDDYSGLEWLGNSQKPTEEYLLSRWPEVEFILQAEEDSKAAKIESRESALAKLSALGLTEEEIGALLNGNS
jgi:DNA-binding NarL/FixJ family response regulator